MSKRKRSKQELPEKFHQYNSKRYLNDSRMENTEDADNNTHLTELGPDPRHDSDNSSNVELRIQQSKKLILPNKNNKEVSVSMGKSKDNSIHTGHFSMPMEANRAS